MYLIEQKTWVELQMAPSIHQMTKLYNHCSAVVAGGRDAQNRLFDRLLIFGGISEKNGQSVFNVSSFLIEVRLS